MLQRLDDGALYADEVLPNPKNPNRALVVLRDVPSGGGKPKNGVTVLEVSANGKGIDVVSSMTGPDNDLKEARDLKAQKGRVSVGGAAVPSSSLSPGLRQQHHPAADFPKLDQNPEQSIAQPDSAGSRAAPDADSPTLRAAAEAIDDHPGLTIRTEDGTDIPARDALLAARDEVAKAETDSLGFMAAVTCFLSKG